MTSSDIFTKHRKNILRYAQEYDIDIANKKQPASIDEKDPELSRALISELPSSNSNEPSTLRVSDIIKKWKVSVTQERQEVEKKDVEDQCNYHLTTQSDELKEYYKQISEPNMQKGGKDIDMNYLTPLPAASFESFSPNKLDFNEKKMPLLSPEIIKRKPPKTDSVERLSADSLNRSSLEQTLQELDKKRVGSEKSSITSKEKLSNDKFIDDKLIQKEIASLGSKSSNEKIQTVFSQLKLQNASQPSKQIQSMIDGLANNVVAKFIQSCQAPDTQMYTNTIKIKRSPIKAAALISSPTQNKLMEKIVKSNMQKPRSDSKENAKDKLKVLQPKIKNDENVNSNVIIKITPPEVKEKDEIVYLAKIKPSLKIKNIEESIACLKSTLYDTDAVVTNLKSTIFNILQSLSKQQQ